MQSSGTQAQLLPYVGRSPPTLDIIVFVPLRRLQQAVIFFAGHCVKLAVLAQTSLLKLRREGRTVGRGMAETWVDQ